MSLPWNTLELPQPLVNLTGSLRALWDQASEGWVGIDFGSSSIKLVQLEKQGSAWRIKHSAVLPLGAESDNVDRSTDELAAASLAELTAAAGLGSIFSTKQAAAVASLGAIELRSFEARETSDEDLSEPAEEGVGRESAEWELPVHLFAPGSGRQRMSAAMETSVVAQLAEAVGQLGLDCCTLDVLPLVLARGLALCDPALRQSATAVLDLGESHPSLTICQEGLPVYCRRLKQCGLAGLHARLRGDLGLSAEESRTLVARYARAPGDDGSSPDRSLLTGPLQTWLRQVRGELIRTLDYLESHRRHSFPDQLIVCGGGGAIPGVAAWFASEVGIPAAPWTLQGESDEPEPDAFSPNHRGLTPPAHPVTQLPLLAAAASLSALAWEL